MQSTAKPSIGLDLWAQVALLTASLLAALMAASRAVDPMMGIHAWLAVAILVVWLLGIALRYGYGAPDFDETQYENGIVKWGVFVTCFWGVAGMLAGVAIAFQLAFPNLLYFDALPFTNF